MSYPGWIAPDEQDVEKNRVAEPEGERLRKELTDWLERNRICGMHLDTLHHVVRIDFGPKLPNEIRNKLSCWGSIYVVVSDEIDWRVTDKGGRMQDWFRRIKGWFSISPKPICKHDWEPLVVNNITYNERKPAKKCKLCNDWRPLTYEQFFEEFKVTFEEVVDRIKKERYENSQLGKR